MTSAHVLETRIGPLYLDATERGLSLLGFRAPERYEAASERVLARAREEIGAYLDGELREFTVPVDLTGHPAWDRRVLDGLAAVGYGETITYGDLARDVGLPVSDARRVGGAMGRNPVAIVVPCHRVIGSDGSLTGYGGGLATKRALLDMENRDQVLF